jgi:hypothetical protein
MIVLSLSAFFCCAKQSVQEKEPNGSFSTANIIDPEKTVEGYLGSGEDRDFYRFSVKREGILDISLSAVKGVNNALKVWKGLDSPVLLKWIDDNRKSSPERMSNIFLSPGIYFIEVLHGEKDARKENLESTYTMALKIRDFKSEEREPNDGPDAANPIIPGSEITGFFSPASNSLNSRQEFPNREEDWFVLDVKVDSGSPVVADVTLSGVSGVNSVLYIYDSDIREAVSADSAGPGKGEIIRNFGIKNSGRYYVVVTSRGGGFNHEEPYTLGVTFKGHDSSIEMENNDDFDRANPIEGNGISGKINRPGDQDFFTYRAVEDQYYYRIELLPPNGMDGELSIYDRKRQKIITLNSAGIGGREVYPDFYCREDFFISVSSGIDSGSIDSGYRLNVIPLAKTSNMEIEPNDTKLQANKMTGNEITGYTSFKGDRDFYQLIRGRRTRHEFTINGIRDGEIKVSITDPLGYILKNVTVRDEQKVILKETVDRTGYIIIESLVENYDNPYRIKIRSIK